jgi:hypothetical protein
VGQMRWCRCRGEEGCSSGGEEECSCGEIYVQLWGGGR